MAFVSMCFEAQFGGCKTSGLSTGRRRTESPRNVDSDEFGPSVETVSFCKFLRKTPWLFRFAFKLEDWKEQQESATSGRSR